MSIFYSRQLTLLEEEAAHAHRNRLLSILNRSTNEIYHDSPKLFHINVVSPSPRPFSQSFSEVLGKLPTTLDQELEVSSSFALLTPSVETATTIEPKNFGPIGSGRLRPTIGKVFTANSIVSVGLREPFGYYSTWCPWYSSNARADLTGGNFSTAANFKHHNHIFDCSENSALYSPQLLSTPPPLDTNPRPHGSPNYTTNPRLPGDIEMLVLLINGDRNMDFYVASRIFQYCVVDGVHQTISVLVDRLLYHGVIDGHPNNICIAAFIVFFVNMIVHESPLATPDGTGLPPPTPSQLRAAFTAHFRNTWHQEANAETSSRYLVRYAAFFGHLHILKVLTQDDYWECVEILMKLSPLSGEALASLYTGDILKYQELPI